MSDAAGSTTYRYDSRGRLIQTDRTIDSTEYTTGFLYDAGDRLVSVTYPTGEVVTQTYNGRGLPETLSGSVAGSLVADTTYNTMGQISRIDLGSGAFDTFAYYGLDAGAPSGYWGRLWQIKTSNPSETLRDVRHTWDANGNLVQRENVLAGETETFGYDFLDRLTSVSGAYNQSYAYNEIGNIVSMNGVSYTYGSQPHAVTAVGDTVYTYDANGNMVTRGNQSIAWDMTNMPVSVSDGVNTSTFVYDGDGSRAMKTEGGETIVYVNQYYEKNITTDEETSHYYMGSRQIAYMNDEGIRYVHQDHLSGTSVTTDSSGVVVATIIYFPFGGTRTVTGDLDTDKLFTGQRLDQTGLYYYNARYYDATIGRFVSADSIVPDYTNPQTLNRYSYCNNNPLRWIDPSGMVVDTSCFDCDPLVIVDPGPPDDPWDYASDILDVGCSLEISYNDYTVNWVYTVIKSDWIFIDKYEGYIPSWLQGAQYPQIVSNPHTDKLAIDVPILAPGSLPDKNLPGSYQATERGTQPRSINDILETIQDIERTWGSPQYTIIDGKGHVVMSWGDQWTIGEVPLTTWVGWAVWEGLEIIGQIAVDYLIGRAIGIPVEIIYPDDWQKSPYDKW